MRSKIPQLVSVSWLQSNLASEGIRLVDCRWVLGQTGEGRRQYEEGHIPGAVHLDLEGPLSGRGGPGRHPIPTKQDFQKVMSEIGVDRERHVIVYDEGNGTPAARLWWLLRYFGHEKVSVLNGGWSVWIKEGGVTEKESAVFPATKFVARPKRKWVVDKVAVDSLRDYADVLLIDARSPERYRGEVEPIDSRPGHIPGAKNYPFTLAIDPETGLFLLPELFQSRFRELGVGQAKTIICYCGSGVTACTDILALNLAGIDALLYEGSWSDWSQDPTLPATKGLT